MNVIRFRMYFTPPGWTTEDGGTLDLFSVDENGCPKEVKCSLVPSFNSVRIQTRVKTDIKNNNYCNVFPDRVFRGDPRVLPSSG